MKKLLAILMVVVMCFSFCSCGLETDDITGTWECKVYNAGESITVDLVVDSDGTYSRTETDEDGEILNDSIGTYTIEGNELLLTSSAHAGVSRYKYENGTLVNGDCVYTKN